MFKRTIMASQYLEKSDSAAKSEAKLNPEPSAAGLSQMGVWMKMPRYYLSASAKNPDSSVLFRTGLQNNVGSIDDPCKGVG